MDTVVAQIDLPEETIDLLTLRAAFQRPGASELSLIDGKLIVWKEDIHALLLAEGLSEDEAVIFQKAASKKDLAALEAMRLSSGMPVDRFDQIVAATPFVISRAALQSSVLNGLKLEQ